MTDDDNFIDELILSGAIEVSGVHEETGELLFTFTKELEQSHPEIYGLFMNHFHNEIMSLWEKGYVEMDPSEDNPIVTITDKGLDAVKNASIEPELINRLKDIIQGPIQE